MFYCELLSGIWIGDVEILLNKQFIKDNDITIILNCTQTFAFPDIEDIQKIRLPFSPTFDSENDIRCLQKNIPKICDFIKKNMNEHNFLICCYEGKIISPLIVALFISYNTTISKKSIYDILLTKNKDLRLWCNIELFH